MTLTIHDITPIGLCIVTQDLFDTKRFQANFCDNLVLRAKDRSLEPIIFPIKRELGSSVADKKFLEGHKTVIISNIDKILAYVSGRYTPIDYRAVEEIVKEGKELVKKVALADTFSQLAALESTFKTKISLPVYSLFSQYNKQRQ